MRSQPALGTKRDRVDGERHVFQREQGRTRHTLGDRREKTGMRGMRECQRQEDARQQRARSGPHADGREGACETTRTKKTRNDDEGDPFAHARGTNRSLSDSTLSCTQRVCEGEKSEAPRAEERADIRAAKKEPTEREGGNECNRRRTNGEYCNM